jgi:hypothetical protein
MAPGAAADASPLALLGVLLLLLLPSAAGGSAGVDTNVPAGAAAAVLELGLDTAVPALPSSPADAIGGTAAGAAANSGAGAGAAVAVAAKSGLVTGVSHCCFGSTGRVAVAVLKASNGPDALVAFTVSVPAGRGEISADSSSRAA